MWNEEKQARLRQLRAVEAEGTLAEADQAELAALKAERCRNEDAAIEQAAQLREQGNDRLAGRVEQVEAQNRVLEELIREQEAYLAEAQELVTQMEARRRQWRERYTQVLGQSSDEASGAVSSR